MASSNSHWFTPVSADTSRPNVEGRQMTFTTTLSTVEDLSYTPSEEQKSRDLAQIKATGRRSWKTLKGKAEAVWGPELESVLIEALEQYQYTDDHKPQTSKHGIRFPYRNRFISQYIHEKTGKTRTHKQVGSRLQQLRDTCEDSRILALISRGSCEDAEDECKQEPEQSPPPSKTGRKSGSPMQDDTESQGRRQVVVYTQITAQLTPPPNDIPKIQFIDNDLGNPIPLHLCPLPYPHSIPGRSPAPLSTFSNLVQFFSLWALNQETKFTIYDGDQAIMQERQNLRLVARPLETGGKGWIYECDIAGGSWRAICESKDPNRITILQSLTPSPAKTAQSNSAIGRKVSIVYHFEVDSHLTAAATPRHMAIAQGTTGYGQMSGSSGGASRHSGYADPSSMGSSPPMWSSASPGYQPRETNFDSGFSSQPQLMHPQSYPPNQHYVLSPQGVGRSHSDSSSLGHTDYDLGSSGSYYSEPRVAHHWAGMSGTDHTLMPANRMDTSSYGVNYSY